MNSQDTSTSPLAELSALCRVVTKPYESGLDPNVVTRLLACKNRPDPKDRVKYEKTEHFAKIKSLCVMLQGSCVLCGLANKDKLTAHHRNYYNLFRESALTDVSCICNRCHGSYHRGR